MYFCKALLVYRHCCCCMATMIPTDHVSSACMSCIIVAVRLLFFEQAVHVCRVLLSISSDYSLYESCQ